VTLARLSSRLLVAIASGIALLVAAATIDVPPLIVWNATKSAPIGLYWIRPAVEADIRVGQLIVLRPTASDASLFDERGYLPLGVPLLKRIAAVGGQSVCEHEGALSIDEQHVADALPTDSSGRPLLAWNGCRRLRSNEVFVLMPEVRASLDGRYFGPTPLSSIVGRATRLLSWKGQ
jgi:conjugative transfer signal peptidase TraF